jgi:hypothetical protein
VSLKIKKVFIYQYNKTFTSENSIQSHQNKKEERLEYLNKDKRDSWSDCIITFQIHG